MWDPRPLQLAKYTVFDEESESEVKNTCFGSQEGKKWKKQHLEHLDINLNIF